MRIGSRGLGGRGRAILRGKATAPQGPPPGPSTNLAAAVQRYDGGSGLATFNGTAMFREGQVPAGDENLLAIFEGSTERPIYVKPLDGFRHADGSLRYVQIQTQITVNDANPVALELRIGNAPTAGTFTPIDPDKTWALNQTLFGLTDATHMCLCNPMPLGPLIPVTDMPATTETFLTTGMDNFLTKKEIENRGAGASYNWGYGWYCRYICTGDLDVLEYINRKLIDETSNYRATGSGTGLLYHVPSNSVNVNINGTPHTDAGIAPTGNWFDPYGDYNMVNAGGSSVAEWYDWTAAFFAGYYLTGSEFLRRALIWQGTSGYAQDHFYAGTVSNARYKFRYHAQRGMLGYLLQPSEIIASDFGNEGPAANWDVTDYPNSWVDHCDFSEGQPITGGGTAGPNDYRNGVWGSSRYINDGGPGITPNFQLETVIPPCYLLNCHVQPDSRIGPGLQKSCEYIMAQITGPHSSDGGENLLFMRYYLQTDPVNVDFASNDALTSWSNGQIDYPYMVSHMPAWLYAYNGDTAARDMWDDMMVYPDLQLNPRGTGGSSTTDMTEKLMGQIVMMLYHGGSWRGGAPALALR